MEINQKNSGIVIPYLLSILFSVIGYLLACIFKYFFGVPNFALGIVIAVTVICYLYGLGPANVTFVLSALAVFIWLFEPAGVFGLKSVEDIMRIVTVFLTSAVTSGLVLLLRAAHTNLDRQKTQIEEQNKVLRTITKELQDTEKRLLGSLQQEKVIAEALQQAFLPEIPERIDAYSLAAAYRAGSEEAKIGGDFYDVYELPNGRLALAIGDVSGKGLHAARQAVTAKYGLRFCASGFDSPAVCLRHLNDLLTQDQYFSGFVTLFYGVIDPEEQTLTYCTGGHEPPLIFREKTGELIRLKLTGRFVGIIPGGIFAEEKIKLEKGDRLFLFTDGLTEARNGPDFLGVEGLTDILSENLPELDINEALKKIIESANSFAGGKFSDDVAAVLLLVD